MLTDVSTELFGPALNDLPISAPRTSNNNLHGAGQRRTLIREYPDLGDVKLFSLFHAGQVNQLLEEGVRRRLFRRRRPVSVNVPSSIARLPATR
jgi:hypothetical protein